MLVALYAFLQIVFQFAFTPFLKNGYHYHPMQSGIVSTQWLYLLVRGLYWLVLSASTWVRRDIILSKWRLKVGEYFRMTSLKIELFLMVGCCVWLHKLPIDWSLDDCFSMDSFSFSSYSLPLSITYSGEKFDHRFFHSQNVFLPLVFYHKFVFLFCFLILLPTFFVCLRLCFFVAKIIRNE